MGHRHSRPRTHWLGRCNITLTAQLITADPLPAARCLDVYLTLLIAAGVDRDDIVDDQDRAAPLGRPARPGPWAEDVR